MTEDEVIAALRMLTKSLEEQTAAIFEVASGLASKRELKRIGPAKVAEFMTSTKTLLTRTSMTVSMLEQAIDELEAHRNDDT